MRMHVVVALVASVGVGAGIAAAEDVQRSRFARPNIVSATPVSAVAVGGSSIGGGTSAMGGSHMPTAGTTAGLTSTHGLTSNHQGLGQSVEPIHSGITTASNLQRPTVSAGAAVPRPAAAPAAGGVSRVNLQRKAEF